MSVSALEPDPFDVRRVQSVAGPLLLEFNAAGVLAPADVHVAARLAALAGENDESVALAAALAVRAPRLGHVHVDLSSIRETAAVDAEEAVDLALLRWPEPLSWASRVAASPLVAAGEDAGGPPAPLRLLASRLYLDRYWADEVAVARDLRAMSTAAGAEVELDVLSDGLRRLFGDERGSRQALAAASAVLRRLAVLAGGPGTGKTTTAARIAARLGPLRGGPFGRSF